MNRNLAAFIFALSVLYIGSAGIAAQNNTEADQLQTIPPVSVDFEASPEYPYGRPNPKAPAETAELSFMIGEFDCVDQIYSPQNKKWFKMNVVRRAEYILNGFAIQDRNWTPILNSTNIRAYDPATKKWHITYFRTPYSTGLWTGGKDGLNMVFLQERGETTSRLSFFDISEDGYSWKAENVTSGTAIKNWEFTCKRRNQDPKDR